MLVLLYLFKKHAAAMGSYTISRALHSNYFIRFYHLMSNVKDLTTYDTDLIVKLLKIKT